MGFKIEGNVGNGDKVRFHDADGEREEKVVYVWEQADGSSPLVNLRNGKTSVPHKSRVPEASSFYYTLVDV